MKKDKIIELLDVAMDICKKSNHLEKKKVIEAVELCQEFYEKYSEDD